MAALTYSSPYFGRSAANLLLALGFIGISVMPTGAVDTIGEAVVIKNSVSAENGQAESARRLAVSDPVHASERVSSAVESHGELRLNDDSLVIVGENSSIELDDFVYSGGNSFTSGTVRVAKGAFRFITGDSPKGTFKVETPLSTIGVRGTVFDVYVDGESGNTKVVLFSGAVRVCSTGNRCVNANRACDIVEVSSPEEVDRIPFLRSAERKRGEEADEFNLTEQQNRFSRRWRAPTVACHARAALESQDPSASGEPAPVTTPQSATPPSSRGNYDSSPPGNKVTAPD